MADAQVVHIPWTKIKESKTNPRRHFDEKSLMELAASIHTVGRIINPLLVRPMNGQYEIVAGARRFRAAKIAGLGTVPAFVAVLTDEEVLEIQVVENLQREDVHPLDEAIGYQQLLARKKYTTATIAEKVGKSQSYVEQRVKLADLIEPARKAYWADRFTVSHAILIARLQPKDQKRALQFALNTWPDYDGSHEYHNPINPEREDDPGDEVYRLTEGAATACSVKDLADFIQKRILLDLRKAAFDPKDEKLVPKAGSCLNCPKRSGFNKELFNDITKSPDICTDRLCFAAKQEAHLIQLKAGFRKEKKRFIEVTADRTKPDGHPGAITERSFKTVKKPCKHSRVGIYIDGANKGETVTICAAKRECKLHWPNYGADRTAASRSGSKSKKETPKQEAKRKQKELQEQIDDAVANKLRDILCDLIPATFTDELKHDDLVDIFHGFEWYGSDSAKRVLKLKGNPENWKQKDLIKAVKAAAFFSAIDSSDIEDDQLDRMAKRGGIDVDGIVEQLKVDVAKEFALKQKEIDRLLQAEKAKK